MRKYNMFPIYKSLHRINSVSEYCLRLYIDQAIHNDVMDFISKNDVATERLVEMLLSGKFTHSRATDPAFPSQG